MKVLSLFDGISAAQVAFDGVGIFVEEYFASEINPYAISVTQRQYPYTKQIGDVKDVWYRKGKLYCNGWSYDTDIDILVGGSPCQDLSSAGKGVGLMGNRSILFFEYVRLLGETNPKYFLFENVASMKDKDKDIISEQLGVEPIIINSNLLTAQNRLRYYWTNIPGVTQPEDLGLTFGDIREHNADDKYYYTEKGLEWIRRHSERTGKKFRIWDDNTKVQMLEQTMAKLYSSQRFFGIPDTKGLRYITPLECERAQGFPDFFSDNLSKTRRYNVLGDSWTIPVIEHIFSFIK